MSYILSSEDMNQAVVNDLLKIKLEEPPNNNYKWEIHVPDSFHIIKGSYTPNEYSLTRTWIIRPTTRGEFTVQCHYRKMCCGNTISKTISYRIIVH